MRLIDVDELLNNRPEYFNEQMDDKLLSERHKGWNKCNREWFDIVKSMPTVDTERHGHWIKKEFIIFDDVYEKVQCSNCHTHWDVSFQYCPYCGAEMDKEK